ncbi:high affinity cAMP-specific and IBMX-insensitive 3',5'-cyclic phosphodiesterase 8 isoform X2 [Chrysoperla carnea]|uniref:high affinity cAMP-specific and IBMX-insensitive 3',5'-cyclic phosphodiesterase 8 isoform X2 n=1 Tax=Chrysoperla carnea TaxID=189513 RepID=UPI001D08E529|nr:high affinity cAMP-specific and IBMX-insensitive 3',5'-cyclic phosphodiesterase 8 isoform X2 [Chrysoperla carnea]
MIVLVGEEGASSSNPSDGTVRVQDEKVELVNGGAPTTIRLTSQGRPSLALTPEEEPLDCGKIERKYGLLLPPNQSSPKILSIFPREDQVSATISKAAEKLDFEVIPCSTFEKATEECLSKTYDLVIIDARTTRHNDVETMCRSVRNAKGNQHTVLVAVVRRSTLEKDEVAVAQLLEAGLNRCIIETTNLTLWTNELLQLKVSEVRPYAQFTTSQALYAALYKSRDVVYITDNVSRIQYMNRSGEKVTMYRQDELIGKSFEFLINTESLANFQQMHNNLSKNREWEGSLVIKRKNLDSITLYTKTTAICCTGRTPTHYVIIQDAGNLPTEWPVLNTPVVIPGTERPRGSVNSIRRGSFDVRSVGSDGIRRSSIAKLNALPLEAPITKAITILTNLQEQIQSPYVQMIDKVIDLIKTNELYSPQMKDDHRLRNDDPVTSDLIGALLSQGPSQILSSRRSSNDSTAHRPSNRQNTTRHRAPAAIRELLETSLLWEFDIFRLEELTFKRPLVHLGMNLMCHFDIPGTLNCDEKTLQNWLHVIESNYRSSNSYHNSTHAADVLQATAGYLEKERLKSILDPLDEATTLIAAAAHDVDHPGKSSAFLCNSDNPLAILYNDLTVLENHHAAFTFKLTLGDERVNIFKNLDKDQYKVVRHNVIDMILATEMTKHFEHLAKFVNVFCSRSVQRDDFYITANESENEMSPINLPENITLVKRMLIKCADVSNPTRPMRICVEWARRIAEEYFTQTDEEKQANLPVVMPMFDRQTCSIPKSQIGFVDYIINDMMEAWDAFIDMPEIITYMRQNYVYWKEYDEQGLTTLGDIKKLQQTPQMSPIAR